MNSTSHVRSIYPNAQGWRELSRFSPPVFRPQTASMSSLQLVAGAGEQADFLDECLRSFVVTPRDVARELGWQPPPAAPISVTLAGRADLEWLLEPEEAKF